MALQLAETVANAQEETVAKKEAEPCTVVTHFLTLQLHVDNHSDIWPTLI